MKAKLVKESLNEAYGDMKGFAAAQSRYENMEDPRFAQEDEDVYYEFDKFDGEMSDWDENGELTLLVNFYFKQTDYHKIGEGWKIWVSKNIEDVIKYVNEFDIKNDKLIALASIDYNKLKKNTKQPKVINDFKSYKSLAKLIELAAENMASGGENDIISDACDYDIDDPRQYMDDEPAGGYDY